MQQKRYEQRLRNARARPRLNQADIGSVDRSVGRHIAAEIRSREYESRPGFGLGKIRSVYGFVGGGIAGQKDHIDWCARQHLSRVVGHVS